MALIHCPECGREISDQAKACPGCGFPMDPQAEETRRLAEAKADDRVFLKRAGAGLLLAVVAILGLVVLIARGIL